MAEPQTIEVEGAELKYYHRPALAETSQGAVVLLHPWYGCWEFWSRTVDALPEFDTYSLDLYSLGSGDNWQALASPQGVARAVTAMADKLGIERFNLMGNSMGGIASQAIAAEEGDRVTKLILVGTGARTTGVKPAWKQTMDTWIAGDVDRDFTATLVDALIARRPEDPAEFERFVDAVANANKAFMVSVLTNAFALDLRPVLPEITAPTLIVRGALDAARTPTHVAELLAGIPGSSAVEIPDAGHSPQVDSPAVFAAIVHDFFAGKESAAKPS